jgi:hypothetical protein
MKKNSVRQTGDVQAPRVMDQLLGGSLEGTAALTMPAVVDRGFPVQSEAEKPGLFLFSVIMPGLLSTRNVLVD